MSRAVMLLCCLLIAACTRISDPILSSPTSSLKHQARMLDAFFLDWEERRHDTAIVIAYRLNEAPLGIDADGIATLHALIPVMPPDSVITIVPYRDSNGSYPFDSAALNNTARVHGVHLLEPAPFTSQPQQDLSADGQAQPED